MICLATVTTVQAFNIDPASPVHPYRQLAAILRKQIADGTITSRLPSYTTLISETGLSLGVVQRAISVLADEHLVVTVQGREVFVRKGRSGISARS